MQRFLALSLAGSYVSARTVRAPTPPMGWNSYNNYNCYPSEVIMKTNADGLVELGLDKLGYKTITTDCGWSATYRDDTGHLVWNPDLFPAGGQALSDYIHGLGLKFGMYSGAGHLQCGSNDQPASLGSETIDAQSFADWGADSLKYDNCFADSFEDATDFSNPISNSPDRFVTMATALNETEKDIVYQVCQWGSGENVGTWASEIATSWRISNDIYNAWRSIWRITNEVVPYYKHTGPGMYPDMDMLIIGLNALSHEEEKFHFGMWAINKSPLSIGAPMGSAVTNTGSLEIMSNKEVIAINQDPLGKQAELVRRYTTAQYDVWLGELSDSRLVLGLANWANDTQTVTVSLPNDLGIASAMARDAWAGVDVGPINTTYTTDLVGHELRLLVLSEVVKAEKKPQSVGYYEAATNATYSGAAINNPNPGCGPGQCLPTGSKVTGIGQGQADAAVRFAGVTAPTAGTKLVGIDYINYDIAMQSAWEFGDNTRNMTISVNQPDQSTGTRVAFPISGGNWFDSGRLYVYLDGFTEGSENNVIITAYGDEKTFAPDLVGFEVFEI